MIIFGFVCLVVFPTNCRNPKPIGHAFYYITPWVLMHNFCDNFMFYGAFFFICKINQIAMKALPFKSRFIRGAVVLLHKFLKHTLI